MFIEVHRALLIALFVIVSSCAPVEPDQGLDTTGPTALLDYNAFVCSAQPALVRHCSFLACHGDDNHALRLYSAGKLRLGSVDNQDDRDAPLTADEVERNFESAAAILLGSTADDRANVVIDHLPLLAKPLAARFGGYEHAGVAVFPVAPAATPNDDPEWVALVSWVQGNPIATPLTGDCADLFMNLGLAPR